MPQPPPASHRRPRLPYPPVAALAPAALQPTRSATILAATAVTPASLTIPEPEPSSAVAATATAVAVAAVAVAVAVAAVTAHRE